jgi:hypothetical protein
MSGKARDLAVQIVKKVSPRAVVEFTRKLPRLIAENKLKDRPSEEGLSLIRS